MSTLEFTVLVKPFDHNGISPIPTFVHPDDKSLLATNDKNVGLRAIQVPTQQVTVGAVGQTLVRTPFLCNVESIRVSSGEFEFSTLWDPVTKTIPDVPVSWGKSTDGAMRFTPDSRCVNREFLDLFHAAVAEKPSRVKTPWHLEVLDLNRLEYVIRVFGVEPHTEVTLSAVVRNNYTPALGVVRWAC